jgi:hypothetical protein
MVGRYMNDEYLETIGRGLIEVLSRRKWGEPWKTSLKISVVAAEIRTEHFSNISLEPYSRANLVSWVMTPCSLVGGYLCNGGTLSSGVKRLGLKFGHSLSCSGEVKNGRASHFLSSQAASPNRKRLEAEYGRLRWKCADIVHHLHKNKIKKRRRISLSLSLSLYIYIYI